MSADKKKLFRCAIYTRVSTDAGLEQDFNSLDAQREASEAFIKSQAHEGWRLIRTAYDDGGFSGGSLDRPALQQLQQDIRAGQVDVIVVYKVDRLTRSLADFAKLVELFDAQGVSFVSVTQAFNTTSSMGRLTLNVLLSFAQFEREVTGERIRDKVAASKKKGIWMGGVVPLGYRVQHRKLLIVPEEAKTVRTVFERYLALGSTIKLLEELRSRGITTKRRVMSDGRTTGGIPFTAGPLSYLLQNRIYVGEIVHRDENYAGEHEPILERRLFEEAQVIRASNVANHYAKYESSEALLIGKLFDDAGNVMGPTHSQKAGRRYRYYTSRAMVEGRKDQTGSVYRVAADDIEAAVTKSLREAFNTHPDIWPDDSAATIRSVISRVIIGADQLTIKLTEPAAEILEQTALVVPWSRRPGRPRRDLILPVDHPVANPRPLHAERRGKHLRAIAQGRRWLQELLNGDVPDLATIASREDRSERSVMMTVSLAFVCPQIIEAAVAGRLPRGIGITRLMDLPEDWDQQKAVLGLPQQF